VRRAPRAAGSCALCRRVSEERGGQARLDAGDLSDAELLQKPLLLERYSVAADRWSIIRDKLLTSHLLGINQSGHYFLGRDLNSFSLGELIELLGLQTEPSVDHDTEPHWFQQAQERLGEGRESQRPHLSISLADLFAQGDSQP